MKMIQRFLYTVLKNGLDQIAADPTLLEDLFKDNYQLSNTEMDSIKTFFENNPIALKHGYAHVEDKFPLMTIVLGSEGENEKYIGYDAGQVEDPDDPDFGADCKSSMWKHTYHILNYAEHPDVTGARFVRHRYFWSGHGPQPGVPPGEYVRPAAHLRVQS
jgi:hypothetical protein